MSNDANSADSLAFSSRCLPGSEAEQKEQERLAEFQRNKALQKAEEERNKPLLAAKRQQAYEAAVKAGQERLRKKRNY